MERLKRPSPGMPLNHPANQFPYLYSRVDDWKWSMGQGFTVRMWKAHCKKQHAVLFLVLSDETGTYAIERFELGAVTPIDNGEAGETPGSLIEEVLTRMGGQTKARKAEAETASSDVLEINGGNE
ncbi:MAG: hypothetical protein SWE60_11350 [Thermodesulfobacteriota bacterium]|nr:hypothetical protein [Thermodesulfobacteriota bacterium]